MPKFKKGDWVMLTQPGMKQLGEELKGVVFQVSYLFRHDCDLKPQYYNLQVVIEGYTEHLTMIDENWLISKEEANHVRLE